ncbi:BgTH12-07180 [Blumeria graminis f. sp. triticale]|uniref:BgTH12-07180 n=1 Tax=Blumeria graminis f. sp. triticale TaxID=1689686 RepID=A0A9W4D8N7_BLUGR|nr:BgTH12-07180 [Blumeria graminis f. sp. triticale]
MRSESPAQSGSPLSTLSSDIFVLEADQTTNMPPAKRQKLGDTSDSLTPPKLHDDASISSDSSGDIPHSPSHQRGEEDEIHEQVTICRWAGCNAGNMLNMDNLVNHIHEDHVETKSKKYICEWNDCGRKSMPHASAYALKAHMRSHTKEKPFYCELPECDRSFTRSDALQKHYRTVHETEALRPSDPIPKSMQAANKLSRQKSNFNDPQPNLEGHPPDLVNYAHDLSESWSSSYPPELGFTPEEEARGPRNLYRLLRRQVYWAEAEADSLKRSCEVLEELRKKEWLDKEVLLDQTLKTDLDWQERRRIVLAQHSDLQLGGAKVIPEQNRSKIFPHDHSSPVPMASIKGQPDECEAATVLASIQKS